MIRDAAPIAQSIPAFAYGFPLAPGDHPHEIPRRRSAQGLEGGAHQAAGTTLVQIQAPDTVREAALDTRPECLRLFALGRLLALAGGLHRLMVRLGADSEWAGRICGGGPDVTGGTGTTGGRGKPDPKHRSAGDSVAWGPLDTSMPLGTAGLVGVPIQDEGLPVIALGDLVWPGVGPKGRPDHIDLVLLRGHQEIGIDIAAVEQMGAREQGPSGHIRDDGRAHRPSGRGRRGVSPWGIRSGGSGSQGSLRGS